MKYQTILEDKIQCNICPRRCKLALNQRGFCHIRRNINNNLVLESYGYNTGLAIDPVEKKPLYHFYPNSNVLSFGTLGCIMGCLYCQNWQTSKAKTPVENCYKVKPKQIIEIAKQYNCKSVAFTYNDPIAFYEYAIDTAKLCRKEGIKTIAVTSGYINPEPAREFFSLMDATNIDLKGFSENFYSKNCLAHIKPVLDTIKFVANETDCHLELTTMIINGENDNDIESECNWILNNLGKNIPLHFSAFFPRYKFSNRKQTDYTTLQRAYNIACSMGLNYVYTGNIPNIKTSTTYCKKCKKPLLKRNGFKIIENNLENSTCKFCQTKLDGKFN